MAENTFRKISVKPPTKREVAILAAKKGMHEYQIIEEALKAYKASQKPAPVVTVTEGAVTHS